MSVLESGCSRHFNPRTPYQSFHSDFHALIVFRTSASALEAYGEEFVSFSNSVKSAVKSEPQLFHYQVLASPGPLGNGSDILGDCTGSGNVVG